MTDSRHCADGCPMFQPDGYVPGCKFWKKALNRDAKACEPNKVVMLITQGHEVLEFLCGEKESETCKPASAPTAPDTAEASAATDTPTGSPKPS